MPNNSFMKVWIKLTSDTNFQFLIPETIRLHTHLIQISVTPYANFFFKCRIKLYRLNKQPLIKATLECCLLSNDMLNLNLSLPFVCHCNATRHVLHLFGWNQPIAITTKVNLQAHIFTLNFEVHCVYLLFSI